MTADQQFILAMFAAVIPIIGLVVAAIMKLNTMHTQINSRMTELLDLTRKAARAEGFKEGQDEHR